MRRRLAVACAVFIAPWHAYAMFDTIYQNMTGFTPELVQKQQAAPDTWLLVAGSNELRFFLNPSRMRSEHRFLGPFSAWVMTVYTKPRPLDKAVRGSPAISRSLARVEIRCSSPMTIRVLQSVYYAPNGDNVSSSETPGPAEEVVPESTGETYAKRACSLADEYGWR